MSLQPDEMATLAVECKDSYANETTNIVTNQISLVQKNTGVEITVSNKKISFAPRCHLLVKSTSVLHMINRY